MVFPLVIAGILAGIAIAIGLVLLIVPGLFLLTIWAVLAPVIVIERSDVMNAFGRSRELVRGNGWQVFGVIVVLFLLQLVVTGVIQAVANSVADSVVGYSVADLIVRLLVAPLSALAAAVLYFELKALRGEPVLGTGADGPGRTTAGRTPAAAPAGTPGARLTLAAFLHACACKSEQEVCSAAGGARGLGQKPLRESPPHLVLPFNA